MTVKEECEILVQALADRFPTGRPVDLKWSARLRYYDKRKKKWVDYYADTSRAGPRLLIRMSKKMNARRRDAHDTLLHEWVHAMDWKGPFWENHPANAEGERDHPPAFWAQYGEIYEWFFHDGGREALGL